MSLYDELHNRGIVKQVTSPALKTAMDAGPITLYCGFDPTSDSLHVGSLLPLLTLKRFQQAGHKAIAVAGGATGMIGDPSFKAQERSLLTEELLAKNLRGTKAPTPRASSTTTTGSASSAMCISCATSASTSQ
jgi:tyrosyl-tRNA synthetase